MNDASAEFRTRPRDVAKIRAKPVQRWDPEYVLASGLEVRESETGGTLFSLNPLMAMRVNAIGYTMLARLSACQGCTATELADDVPGLSPVSAERFLDNLTARRLLTRTPERMTIWPSVTVIVPAHGRPKATKACVKSLLSLDYPRERIEIIVVDDASDPPLASALADQPVRLLRLDRNLGQSAARNLAAAEARGELLAFIDNDCVAAPHWLHDLVPYLGDPDTAIVGGRVVAPPPDGSVAAYEAVCSPLDMGATEGAVGPTEAIAYLPTCNLVVRRDVLLAEGGFDAQMRVGEDVDFTWRVLREGRRAYYAAAGEVAHDHRVRLGALLRRRADYGFSEAELQCRHPETRSPLPLPRTGIAALVALTSVSLSWQVGLAPAVLALALGVVELAGKKRRLERMHLAIPMACLVASVLREHAASVYHLGRHVTRYYGLPLVIVCIAWPPLIPSAAVLMIGPAVCDHHRLGPRLGLHKFLALYLLDMAAYQLGVWRGCAVHRCWRPLLPAIRWRR